MSEQQDRPRAASSADMASAARAAERRRDLSTLLAVMLTLIGIALLGIYWLALREAEGPRLADLALGLLPRTGVENPVTAVLLNYRAYDTLMELAVLLAALLGIWSLGPAPAGFQRSGHALAAMVSWVVPLLIVAAGYMLWVGGFAPGGAFQAGALLGAAGVIIRLAGDPTAGLPGESAQRLLSALGVLVFALVGLALLGFGGGFLTYPPTLAKWLILLIEAAATLAIGVALAAAYVGGRPPPAPTTAPALGPTGSESRPRSTNRTT